MDKEDTMTPLEVEHETDAMRALHKLLSPFPLEARGRIIGWATSMLRDEISAQVNAFAGDFHAVPMPPHGNGKPPLRRI